MSVRAVVEEVADGVWVAADSAAVVAVWVAADSAAVVAVWVAADSAAAVAAWRAEDSAAAEDSVAVDGVRAVSAEGLVALAVSRVGLAPANAVVAVSALKPAALAVPNEVPAALAVEENLAVETREV